MITDESRSIREREGQEICCVEPNGGPEAQQDSIKASLLCVAITLRKQLQPG